jgi:hypothetical protein
MQDEGGWRCPTTDVRTDAKADPGLRIVAERIVPE